MWFDELAENSTDPQLVNDSKTPSGPVHVGSLRGVLIHDAVFRALRDRGIPARYTFGVDDYDPLDELPPVGAEELRPHLGKPLCDVPPPAGSPFADLAEHHISGFFDVFAELGVAAETYRVRDLYRSGTFDVEIDAILRNSSTVRRVYREVAGARRDDDWFPFQVICERCGRVGTTRVDGFTGDKVSYQCVPDLVTWATGCGNRGKVSPFSGRGKLPWKLEWVAKWNRFDITIEGAGKDHNTKGGSRSVAVRCLQEIFGKEPPVNIPYEFFLVKGAKMSSSRGVGVSARKMADLLAPELLRFLMVRSLPRRPVDFAPEYEKIVRLYDDFDRARARAAKPREHPQEARLTAIAEVKGTSPVYFAPPFDVVVGLVQFPHVDPVASATRMKGEPLTELELERLAARLASARFFLEHFAAESDRLKIQRDLPAAVRDLDAAQRVFLRQLADDLGRTDWSPEAVQTQIFGTARLVPIAQPAAFAAIYIALFAKDRGPKAGNILAFLDREWVCQRFASVPDARRFDFLAASSTPIEDVETWLAERAEHIIAVSARAEFICRSATPVPGASDFVRALGVLELTVTTVDGRVHLRRCALQTTEGYGATIAREKADFLEAAGDTVSSFGALTGHSVVLRVVET
ncbi:Lysine--tRNA ligase [Actinomadura rubteroloni]|uniref:Lysine--tRNA ligase n=1 Tax=Actinomadura rubteroloni TaxID=1926885 RepID=A0A2P4UN48_9ACTN|nr:lysine--tRNA ligase [Actinomadura rubteroloni]POM26472.1 Lysine--tRNA ligase [Actinomadura rubteroloni]